MNTTPAQQTAGHTATPIAYGHMSDYWVANRVRMLMRTDLEFEPIVTAARDRILRLCEERAALQAENERLLKRIAELEPGAECWDALCGCYRITFMGSAGLGSPTVLTAPFDPKGYAHVTLNFWTSQEPPEGHTGDEQDRHGRIQLSKFIEVALRNRAALSTQAEKESPPC